MEVVLSSTPLSRYRVYISQTLHTYIVLIVHISLCGATALTLPIITFPREGMC